MDSFTVVTTMIAWLLFLNTQPQNPSVLEKQSLLEKRAVADTQRILASELDAALPKLSFADWFEKVVGPGTGIIWQLSECGERQEAAPNATRDLRACVDANAMLADGRRVILRILVGAFKKGITGAPAFYFGVVEQKGDLYTVRRLRDLQKLLSDPESLAKTRRSSNSAIKLPELNIPKFNVAAGAHMAGSLTGSEVELDGLTLDEEPPPEPPPPLEDLGSVSWGDAIIKTQPRYPAKAKRVNASGPVEVQITISAEGRVTEAKAISGHPLLREAAEDAARQWVFKPATLNGVPMEAQRVLTFLFKASQ